MKIVCFLAVIALVGCTSQPAIGDLEKEALQTGDWSAVDDRARMIERMRVATEPKCPENFMQICVKDGEHEECYCQSRR